MFMRSGILAALFILIISSGAVFSQESKAPVETFEFIPGSVLLKPFMAGIQEPHFGLLYYPSNGEIKIEIGGSYDLFLFRSQDMSRQLSFGLEFMAYALSKSYKEYRLQIDALDGFFGGHAAYSLINENNIFSLRFRFVHHSAHLVDGHWDKEKREWIDGKLPISFTVDFMELTAANEIIYDSFRIRYYGGAGYSVLIRPDNLNRAFLCAGFELSTNKLTGNFLRKETSLFTAYQFSLEGRPEYTGSNHVMAGIKLGKWDDRGILLFASYFWGNDFFGEYYFNKVSEFGLGFRIDFH